MLNPSRHYYTVVISAYVFFVRDDEILLSRRFNTGYHDGDYSLPAGHVEEGEFSTTAAIREAKEEVGVSIDKGDLIPAHIMHRHCGDHERIDIFFAAKKWTGDLVNAEPNKCDEIKWFKMNDLPDNTIPYVKAAIENYHQGASYSEFSEPDDKIL